MSNETDVRIGKFDILATYTYAKALLEGISANDAKERGIVAAIMGAKARLGHTGGSQEDHQTHKTAAEKKKKTTITAERSTIKSPTRWVNSSIRPFFRRSRKWSKRTCLTTR
jgi:hypothetical protein